MITALNNASLRTKNRVRDHSLILLGKEKSVYCFGGEVGVLVGCRGNGHCQWNECDWVGWLPKNHIVFDVTDHQEDLTIDVKEPNRG